VTVVLIWSDNSIDRIFELSSTMNISLRGQIAHIFSPARGGTDTLPPTERQIIGSQISLDDFFPIEVPLDIH